METTTIKDALHELAMTAADEWTPCLEQNVSLLLAYSVALAEEAPKFQPGIFAIQESLDNLLQQIDAASKKSLELLRKDDAAQAASTPPKGGKAFAN